MSLSLSDVVLPTSTLPDFPAPIAPEPPPRYEPDAYYGLLTNPPGTYGRAKWGISHVITLRGSDQFREWAINLFSTYAEPLHRMPDDTYVEETGENPMFRVHQSHARDCVFFCMSLERATSAVRLFLYMQIASRKAQHHVTYTEDGVTPYSVSVLNEEQLDAEAAHLAESFMHHYVLTDYGAIPESKNAAEGMGIHSVAAAAQNRANSA